MAWGAFLSALDAHHQHADTYVEDGNGKYADISLFY